MNFMNRLERKFGKYAISNLSLYIIICYVIGYVLMIVNPQLQLWLQFSPYYIVRGQVWRLVTWLLMPPSSLNLFTIIMLLFYYSIGTSLERTMGAFRYNVFIFGGVILTEIGMLAMYGIGILLGADKAMIAQQSSKATTYYLCLSMFLAYSLFYPDMQVLLYFVIPVKVRWIAILDVILIAYEFVMSEIGNRVVIGMAILNLILFFATSRRFHHLSPGEIKRRSAYKKQVERPKKAITRHKCAVCGRTEQDGDDLVFRFCSRCNGNYEYCQDHIFTHTHIQ